MRLLMKRPVTGLGGIARRQATNFLNQRRMGVAGHGDLAHRTEHAHTRPLPAMTSNSHSSALSTAGKFYLEGRALAQDRRDPDAPTVHLDGLLGHGEPEAGATVSLGGGTIDPDGSARICAFDVPKGRLVVLADHAHLSCFRELDGIAHEVEEHCVSAAYPRDQWAVASPPQS